LWGKAAISGDVVFAASLDKKVYALNAKTGAKIAEYDLAGQISSDPVLVKNKLVVATQNATLWTIDTANPAAAARKVADIPKDVSSALAARGDIVYINAVETGKQSENKLFGFNIETGAFATPVSLNY